MSEEKKKKKAAKIIAGIVGAAALIGGATGGIIEATETEAKEEEENEGEGEKTKPVGSKQKTPNTKPIDNRQDLATVITTRNLGTIATNGLSTPTEDMIKAKLPTGIDKSQIQIEIKDIKGNTATVKPIQNSIKYKGTAVTVTYTLDTKQVLATALQGKTNLGTIATNGALQPTKEQITTELAKKSIDITQVEITNISATQATVSAKTSAGAKYKGTATVTYTLDTKQVLATILSQAQRNFQLKSEDKLKMTGLEKVKEVIKERLIENNPQLNLIKEKIILSDIIYNMNVKPIILTIKMTYNDPAFTGSVILTINYPN